MLFSLFLTLFACREKPDVILLTLDTLRYDHVGAFNPQSPAKTPNIDALAKDGVRYTNTYSPISVTGPAFTSLLTGQDIATHGVSMNVFRGGKKLEKSETTITEIFPSSFQKGAFVSGFTLRSMLGLDQGFDVYNASLQGKTRRWGNETAKLATAWLKKTQKEGKAFLWYHSYDAHGPWKRWGKKCPEIVGEVTSATKIPKYQKIPGCNSPTEYKKRYAKAVQFADRNIGKIIKALKRQERYDDAMIILTSDHGESFAERELWFDHGTTAHEEQLHVPLIIKYPKNKNANTEDSRLISLIDIAPTIAEIADLGTLDKATGHSLLDSNYNGAEFVIGESSHCKKEPVLSCTPHGPKGKEYALRNKDETLILKGVDWTEYNRNTDRTEIKPLSIDSTYQSTASNIFQQKQSQAEQIDWPPKKQKDETNETRMLQQLGYMGED